MKKISALFARLANYKNLLVRMVLVAMLWLAAMWGYGAVANVAFNNNSKPLQRGLNMAAIVVAQSLQQEFALLEKLAQNPTLAGGLVAENGTENIAARRAIYSFSYQNRMPHMLVWHGGRGDFVPLATTFAAGEDLFAWVADRQGDSLALTPEQHQGAWYLTGAYPLTRSGLNAVVLRLSLQAVLKKLILPSVTDSLPGVQVGLAVQTLNAEQSWFAGPKFLPQNIDTAGGIRYLYAPLPNLAGWQVGYSLAPGSLLGNYYMVQWLLVVLAILFTALVFWPYMAWPRAKIAKLSRPLAIKLQRFWQAKKSANKPARSLQDGPEPVALTGGFAGMLGGVSLRLKKISTLARPRVKNITVAAEHNTPNFSAKPLHNMPEKSKISALKPRVDTLPTPDEAAKTLQQCLAHNRVKLAFQAMYDTTTRQVVAHEVLARFIDEDGAALDTQTMLQAAKNNQLIDAVDARVLELVLAEVAGREAGQKLLLSMNVAGQSTKNIAYLQKLMAPQYRALLPYMMLEISSREMLADTSILKFLKDCQMLGVKLAIDYFGGGAAMIEGAAKLKMDFVKIDARRFDANEDAQSTLVNLGFVAKRVNIPLILEKVEHIEMERLGRKAGIGIAQGYLFTAPTTYPDMADMPSWQDGASKHEPA